MQKTTVPGLTEADEAYLLDDGVTRAVVRTVRGASPSSAFAVLRVQAWLVDDKGVPVRLGAQRIESEEIPVSITLSALAEGGAAFLTSTRESAAKHVIERALNVRAAAAALALLPDADAATRARKP